MSKNFEDTFYYIGDDNVIYMSHEQSDLDFWHYKKGKIFSTYNEAENYLKKQNITFIDLFSGIGGFRIALENSGAKCVFSSEVDQKARDVYKKNFNEEPFGDIKKINEKTIPDHDILCAGFPCQPFSIAGKRKGFEDTRGTLFFDIARIVKEKKT